ncbi:hypothetical protein HY227_02550 [Candidatus Wolfebacteria bacterium]|nr:hypothetical protein [Candidatus Wolfebacteria bacterium]
MNIKNKKGFINIIIAAVVALVLVVSGGYYFYSKQSQKFSLQTPQSLINESNIGVSSTASTTTNIKTEKKNSDAVITEGNNKYSNNSKSEVKVDGKEAHSVSKALLIDCGAVGPDNPIDMTKIKGCFESKFKDCDPAKMIVSVDMGPLGGLMTYYYEIIGTSKSFCSVKSKFLKSLNPDWVGKEMICNYDNTKNFDVAVKDFIDKCSGSLYDLMTQGMQLHNNSNCSLGTNLTKIESLRGVNSSVTASGFKGSENQISWIIKDTNIATVLPLSGKTVMLKLVNVGLTQLIATDNAADPNCSVTIPIVVK